MAHLVVRGRGLLEDFGLARNHAVISERHAVAPVMLALVASIHVLNTACDK
jgi:hypothetical protein